jgi:hypothetical protein
VNSKSLQLRKRSVIVSSSERASLVSSDKAPLPSSALDRDSTSPEKSSLDPLFDSPREERQMLSRKGSLESSIGVSPRRGSLSPGDSLGASPRESYERKIPSRKSSIESSVFGMSPRQRSSISPTNVLDSSPRDLFESPFCSPSTFAESKVDEQEDELFRRPSNVKDRGSSVLLYNSLLKKLEKVEDRGYLESAHPDISSDVSPSSSHHHSPRATVPEAFLVSARIVVLFSVEHFFLFCCSDERRVAERH